MAAKRGAPASQQGCDIRTAIRSNRAPLPAFTVKAAITRSAAMTDFDRPEKPEDPEVLRSAAVDALRDAARQSDPREFNRLTRHALALIERARAIRHGGRSAVSEAAEAEVLQRNANMNPRPPRRRIEFIVRFWRSRTKR
jgi:hypothetical protein